MTDGYDPAIHSYELLKGTFTKGTLIRHLGSLIGYKFYPLNLILFRGDIPLLAPISHLCFLHLFKLIVVHKLLLYDLIRIFLREI